MILDLHIWWDSTDCVSSNDPWPPYVVRFRWQCHLNDPWPPYLVGFHWQCLFKWSLISISDEIPLTMSTQMVLDFHIWWDSTDNVSSNDHWPPYMVGFHWQCHLKLSLTSVSDEIPLTMSSKLSFTSISGGIPLTMSPKWSLTSIYGGIPPTMSPQMILDLHIWWDSTDNVISNDPWPPFLVGFHWLCLLKWSLTSICGEIPLTMSPKWSLTSISGGIPLTMSLQMILDLHIWWDSADNVPSNGPWLPYLVGFHRQCLLKWSLTSVYGGFPLIMSSQIILDLCIWWDSTDNVT